MILIIIITLLALSCILFIFTKPKKPNKHTETGVYLRKIKDNGYKLNYMEPKSYDYLHCAVWIHDTVTNTNFKTIPVQYYITLNTENEVIDIDNKTLDEIKYLINTDNNKRTKIINRDMESTE